MKKVYKSLLILLFTFATATMFSQAPPPPPPNHGSTGNTNGGTAPIGSGLVILIGLATAYGGRKLYVIKKESLEE